MLPGGHQWYFKTSLILAQNGPQVKAHLVKTANGWSQTLVILYMSLMALWGHFPKGAEVHNHMAFDFLVGSNLATMLLTVCAWKATAVVLSAVHTNNVEAFLVGIAGHMQLVEFATLACLILFLTSLTYCIWMRFHVFDPDMFWPKIAFSSFIPAMFLMLAVYENSMSLFAVRAGLMSATPAISRDDVELKETGDLFQAVWRRAQKGSRKGAAVKLHSPRVESEDASNRQAKVATPIQKVATPSEEKADQLRAAAALNVPMES